MFFIVSKPRPFKSQTISKVQADLTPKVACSVLRQKIRSTSVEGEGLVAYKITPAT